MSITREFHGFMVSDDFVLTLNSRGGTVDVNLQEMMALRLEGSTSDKKMAWYDSNQSSGEVITVTSQLGLSFNHEQNCRSSSKWTDAKSHFVKNNNLDVDQAKLLDSVQKRTGKVSDDGQGVRFNATNAKALGEYIFNSVPEPDNQALDRFTGEDELWVVDYAVGAFVDGLFDALEMQERFEIDRKAELERIEREEKLEKVKAFAVTTLQQMGISEDSENYEEMLKTQMGFAESMLDLVS